MEKQTGIFAYNLNLTDIKFNPIGGFKFEGITSYTFRDHEVYFMVTGWYTPENPENFRHEDSWEISQEEAENFVLTAKFFNPSVEMIKHLRANGIDPSYHIDNLKDRKAKAQSNLCKVAY